MRHSRARRLHVQAVEKRCGFNKPQTRSRCSSVAIDFSNAEGWCAYHLLRNHLLHCLCPRARRRNLQRFRQRKWMSNQSARRTASACRKFQPTRNQKMTSCWSNSSLFRLLESRDRQRSGQFFSCTPINKRRSLWLIKSETWRELL